MKTGQFNRPLASIMVLGLFLASMSAYLCSCSTSVDLNGPYKETGVIYSLLNPDSSYQYARISKTFQNRDLDANQIAKTLPDSSNYKKGNITVELIEIAPTGKATTIAKFHPMDDNSKKTDGDFYAPNQILYKSDSCKLKDASNIRYKLRLTNNITGYVTDASCSIVGGFRLISPSPTFPTIGFYKNVTASSIIISKPTNGETFKLNVTTHYAEYNTDGSIVEKSFFWSNAGSFGYSDADRAELISTDGNTYFSVLENFIKPDPKVDYRKFRSFDLEIWAGESAINNYFVLANSLSITSDDKPLYSNFRNGLGLLSSRRFIIKNAAIAPDMVITMNSLIKNSNSPNYPDLVALKFKY